MGEEIPAPEPLPDEEQVLPSARQSPLKIVLRVAIAAAVIAVLLKRTDTHEMAEALRNARPLWILIAFGVILVGLCVSALRWQAFLRPLGIPLRWGTLFRLYFVGTFFNAFLPTGVGGDAYKAMRLRRGPRTLSPALASVVLDRVAGIIGLGIIGLTGVALRAWDGDLLAIDTYRGRAVTIAAVLSLGVLVASSIVLVFGERLMFRAGRASLGVLSRVRRTLASFSAAGRHAEAFARGFVWGVVFQGLVLLSHLALARALGIHVPVAGMACIVVIASIAALMPTPNGIGFREAAYKWSLGAFGVGSGPGLAFAFLVLAVLLAASAVGGLVYMVAGGEVAPQALGGRPGG